MASDRNDQRSRQMIAHTFKRVGATKPRWRVWLILGAITVLAGAACPGQREQAQPDPCDVDQASRACVCAREPDSAKCRCLTDPSAQGCLCVLEPELEECLQPPPCPQASARDHTTDALKRLSDGQWEEGRRLVNCALAATPDYRRAQKIKDQLDADPSEYLKRVRGSQSITYEVRRSDTLGSIAKRCLGDTDLFVVLARLNEMERPSALARGERLRIVGSISCQQTRPVNGPRKPSPPTGNEQGSLRQRALNAESSGDLAKAYALIVQDAKQSPNDSQASTHLARIKTAYVGQLRDRAYELQDSGQRGEAREVWQRVQAIDPANFEARLNLQDLDE